MMPATIDRRVVVFRLWPSLRYELRMVLGLALIAAGLAIQVATRSAWFGIAPMVAGNLLLIVRGYDNRVDLGRYRPSSRWEPVEIERLGQIESLHRAIKRWDRSLLDATNPLGGLIFLVILGGATAAILLTRGAWQILAIDGAALLLPHWVTGVRRILTCPHLLIKVRCLRALLDSVPSDRWQTKVLMLFEREGAPIPDDVKIKLMPSAAPEEFLGLYGQVVLNEVQGSKFPYFYMVLVARRGFGLDRVFERYRPPRGVTPEYKIQDEVEVLVVRQTTTKRSGYHTKPPACRRLLAEGLMLAQQVG